MSGIDPLSVAGIPISVDIGTLGIPLDVIQAQLSLGDVLTATVLAPQGGVDLLEILGQSVVAQLPPDVYPGETLLLQVTAFQGNQIVVANLGPPDPQNPVPSVSPATPESATQSATLVTVTPANAQASSEPETSPEQVAPQGPLPQAVPPQASPVSPPSAVFVAASVTPAQAGATEPPARPTAAANAPAARVTPDVEARIFAAKAAQAERAAKPVPESIVVQRPSGAKAPAAPQSAPALSRAPLVSGRTAPAATPAARTPEAALLSALRLSATPRTLAAAKAASQAVTMLPRVLQRLDAVLPRVTTDARISTLRTMLSFVSKIDPGNERALPQQISAFVSNVLDGAGTKLAQLLRAYVAQDGSSPAEPPATPHSGAAQQSPRVSNPQTVAEAAPQAMRAPAEAPQNTVQSPVSAGATIAERSIALEHDVKALVLSLVHQPPLQSTPEFAQALGDALTTLTGAQLGSLSANANDPTAMIFSIPVFFHENGQPARIRIDRDAPNRKEKLDADNFHVAFVLDTPTLGTVAIDLETVGRAVKVNVKTEREPAADRFKSTLVDLGKRLEKLRYRVSSMNASVAPPVAASTANAPGAAANVVASRSSQDGRRLDLQA